MTPKPQSNKTIDETLKIFGFFVANDKTASKKIRKQALETAKQAITQAMLDALPEKKNIDYREGYTGNRISEAKSEGFNQAIDQAIKNIKECINGSHS